MRIVGAPALTIACLHSVDADKLQRELVSFKKKKKAAVEEVKIRHKYVERYG
jgi:hypothetical protein